MINALRAELLKMRSMPGVWVTFGLAFPLTVLVCPGRVRRRRAASPGTPSTSRQTLQQQRELLGAGYFGIEVLAPIIGVLCITSEYRHKTMTTSLVLRPVRTQVLAAKVVATALWSILLAVLTLVAVGRRGPALERRARRGHLPGDGPGRRGGPRPAGRRPSCSGSSASASARWSRTRSPAILLTIGGTLILESILIALARAIFHYDLNWLPNGAGAALAGDIARGFGGGGRGRDVPPSDLVAGRPGHAGLGPRAPHHRLLHDVPPRRHLSSVGASPPGPSPAAQPRSTTPGRAARPSSAARRRPGSGTPFTSVCVMPTGASAVRRSPSAGKSRTRRSGPGATVSGSKTHRSAAFPTSTVPRSASP